MLRLSYTSLHNYIPYASALLREQVGLKLPSITGRRPSYLHFFVQMNRNQCHKTRRPAISLPTTPTETS